MGATSCSVISTCTHYHYDKKTGKASGDKVCLKCEPMQREVSKGNFTKRFFTMDYDQLAQIEDDRRFPSLFDCLRHVDPLKRQIFEDHEIGGISMNEIAKERNMSKSSVQRAIREVRHDCKRLLGLSTVF